MAEPQHATQTSQTSIADLGEFGLIERIQSVLGEPKDDQVVRGIGDDAAVYRIGEERVHVVTTDALIDGVHFDRAFVPMEYLGFKSISVNTSDVAAMNAQPRYATVALGLPSGVPAEAVESLYEGMRKACEAYGITLVGGDLTAAHRMTLAVTVIGEADEADVVYRSGAQEGDLLCLSGDVGGAYAGLKVLLSVRNATGEGLSLAEFPYAIGRQLAPVARLDAVRVWADHGVRPTALIDVSDGVASEVHHLCAQSGLGAQIYGEALPTAEETRQIATRFGEDPLMYALSGGEDYELLFTLAETDLDRLEPGTFAVIGQMTAAGTDVLLHTPEGETRPLSSEGYQHFNS
ncbi:MAG: thiamine-phosphate kinase [Rhodothermales bacterium]